MTNDLKNFLDGEQQDVTHKMFNDVVDEMEDLTPFDFMGRIRDHDIRLVNFVLDLVGKEVGKLYKPYEGEEQIMIEHHMLDDISTIINKLRV